MKPYEKLSQIYDYYWGKFSIRYIPLLKNLFDQYDCRPESVLDLACGTGVLIAELSRKSDHVVGLDISPQMLGIAEKNCRKCNNIKLVEGDFRSFDLGEKFDLILCCFDSANYVNHPRELAGMFSCVSKHLNEIGLFVFDVVTERLLQGGAGIVMHREINGISYEHSCAYDPVSKVAETVFSFESGEERHYQVPVEYDDVLNAMKKTDLSVVEAFASFDKKPISEITTRLFFVVRKANALG